MREGAWDGRYRRVTEWPLTVASVVFLAAYAWPILQPAMPGALRRACSVATVVIWIAFGCDFLIQLVIARRRASFVRHHVLDLLVLVLPLLRPLRALRVITALSRLNARAVTSLRGRAITYVVGGLSLLGFTAAVAVLDAERAQPDSNIRTFGDAVWWALTTITTVGYGDRYPTTSLGRLAGIGLMIGGIALVGVVTAALASWFVDHVRREEQNEAELNAQISSLVSEVRVLRSQLDRLAEANLAGDSVVTSQRTSARELSD